VALLVLPKEVVPGNGDPTEGVNWSYVWSFGAERRTTESSSSAKQTTLGGKDLSASRSLENDPQRSITATSYWSSSSIAGVDPQQILFVHARATDNGSLRLGDSVYAGRTTE